MNANNWLLAAKTSSWNKQLSGEEGLHLHFTQNVVTFEYLKCRQRQNLLAVNSKTDVRLAFGPALHCSEYIKISLSYPGIQCHCNKKPSFHSTSPISKRISCYLWFINPRSICFRSHLLSLLPRRVFCLLEKYSVQLKLILFLFQPRDRK